MRRQTFHLVKSWQPAPASALSNAIRFVGEKDEGDSREEKEGRMRSVRREKLLELSVINTLNFFFPNRTPDLTRSLVH